MSNIMKRYHPVWRFAACAIVVALAVVCQSIAAKERLAAAHTPGIVAAQPTKGPFVRVDGGFMVPYTEKIPGTDITFEMIPIAGGEFVMGSPPSEAERNDDEGPQVRIKVEPFWIGKYEVAWGEY
jgi:formylglycine-generating enzyme required for sulfatase activity